MVRKEKIVMGNRATEYLELLKLLNGLMEEQILPRISSPERRVIAEKVIKAAKQISPEKINLKGNIEIPYFEIFEIFREKNVFKSFSVDAELKLLEKFYVLASLVSDIFCIMGCGGRLARELENRTISVVRVTELSKLQKTRFITAQNRITELEFFLNLDRNHRNFL